jgi:prolipoprotein diacylglyceryl transferase
VETSPVTEHFIWNVDREIVGIGIFALRWYSLLFAAGFVFGYFFMARVFTAEGRTQEKFDSLLFHLVAGTVIGARLGHCLFYEPQDYLTDPLRILKIWEGGLASHGGFTGVLIALLLFCRKNREIPFFWLTDRLCIPAMVCAGCIRIGNFFNSEIVGHPFDGPWAVIFQKHDMVPRHPTQLYEAAGYFTISIILYAVYRLAGRKPLEGRLFGLNMALAYGFRTFIETYKENQVPFENDLPINMGQILSLPFILLGIFFALGLHKNIPFFQRGISVAGGGTAAPADGEPAMAMASGGETLDGGKRPRRGGRGKKR